MREHNDNELVDGASHALASVVSYLNQKLALDTGCQSADASEPTVAAGETRLSCALA